MGNNNYSGDGKKGQNRSAFTRREDEKYFLFVTEDIKIGDYVEIIQLEFMEWGTSRQCVKAPKGILIVREELLAEEGGLDEVVRKLKTGELVFPNLGR